MWCCKVVDGKDDNRWVDRRGQNVKTHRLRTSAISEWRKGGERINYGHVMISVSQLERVAAAGGIASSCIFEMSLILETSSSV